MQDMPQKELDAIEAERAKLFTSPWFGDLIHGRLGFGETFWMGFWVLPLIAVPVVVLLPYWLSFQSPAAMSVWLLSFYVLLAIWFGAMLRALLISRAATGARGGYVIAGIGWGLLQCVGILVPIALALLG